MKIVTLVFATVMITVSGFAQKTADIGIWGGTSTYWGDVRVPAIQSFNPNFGGLFRYNFNKRVGLRIMFLTGNLSADGTIEDVPWSFKKNAQDITAQVEINYLDYVLGYKKTPFSPYIMGGLGIMSFPYNMDPALISLVNPSHVNGTAVVDESVVALTIPLAFGFKFSIGSRLGLGIEYQLRKLFSDKLDDLDDPLAFRNDEDQLITYTDLIHNNDWPGYLGIHVTYKIYLGQKACPAYDSKN